MTIVILDSHTITAHDALNWDALNHIGKVHIYPRTSPKQIVERTKDAEVVLTNKVPFTAETISQLPKLRYIGVTATGYNIVDIEAASRAGITVTNVPAYSTASVAQMTWAHILNITNRIDHYAHANRQGRWSQCPDFCYYDMSHTELAGKTIGIIGMGNIGMAVAHIALAFGLNVQAYTGRKDLPTGITSVSLDTLFSTSHIITLHCPLTPNTHHLVDATRLAMIQPGTILINTSRGPVVDEIAVSQALHSGRLSAYGADVMQAEPPSVDNPLLNAPNAFITPHIAWATIE